MPNVYNGQDFKYIVRGKPKKFGGELYSIVSIMTTEPKAKGRAKELRAEGFKVRISESSDGYRVYVRNK